VLIARSIGFKVGAVRALSIELTIVSALLVAAHFLRSTSSAERDHRQPSV
jgi:hypothetical protein